MRVKYTTIINNNISNNFLLSDNEMELLSMSFQH